MRLNLIILGAVLSLTVLAAPEVKEPEAVHLTAAGMEQAFGSIPTKPPTNKTIIAEDQYQVAVARVAGRDGPVELHRDSDRIFFVRSGRARLRIGGTLTNGREIAPGEWRDADGSSYRDYRTETMTDGSVISVPRRIPYQIIARDGDVSFTVIRIK